MARESKEEKQDLKVDAPKATPVASAPIAEPVEKAYPDKMSRYRVKKAKVISLRGSVTQMPEGKVLDPRQYGGPKGIQMLKDAGVELEEIS